LLTLPWLEPSPEPVDWIEKYLHRQFEQARRDAAYERLAAARGWMFWGEQHLDRASSWLSRIAPDLPVDHLHVFSSDSFGVGSFAGPRPGGQIAFLNEPYFQGPGVTHEQMLKRAHQVCAPLLKIGWSMELTTGEATIHWPGWTVLMLLVLPAGQVLPDPATLRGLCAQRGGKDGHSAASRRAGRVKR